MVRVDGPKAAAFRVEPLAVECLEERCVLALPWPVDPASIVGIAATYGQFDNRGLSGPGGIHFHEGVDILVASLTEVYAIEDGTVAKVVTAVGGEPYYSWVSVATTSNSGWNYVHIAPDPALTEGAKVIQGKTRLGKVVPYPGNVARTHLHLDAAGGLDPSDPRLLRPVNDPLALLNPLGDKTAPTVGDVYFMRGEDDNNFPYNLTGGTKIDGGYWVMQEEPIHRTNHGYFWDVEYSKAVIVGHYAPAETWTGVSVHGTSNIDIIVNASDKITATDPQPVGLRSIEFKAAGQFIGKTIPTVRPFDFVGEFVYDPNQPFGTQDYDALRISDLTRVAYQNDADSPSNAEPPAAITFFHIVTNTDAANSLVDFEDRKRYWRSKVTQGSAWNDIGSTEAVNNTKGAFPDDYYTITVTARDAAGNSKSAEVKVLLDNWQQAISYETIPDPLLPPGHTRVRVTGSQFTGNATVKVYLMTSTIADGQAITDHGALLGAANTDADGNIVPTDFVFLIPPNGFFLLADYHNGDNVYQPRLDAVSVSTLIDPNSPMLVIGLNSFAGSAGPAGGAPAGGGPTRPDAPADGPGPVRPPGVVSPVFGFGVASGELISFDVPTGEPTVRPGRPALPPAGEMSQTVPRPLDLAEGGRRHGVDPGLDLGSSAGPFVALSPGGPNDPLGPAG